MDILSCGAGMQSTALALMSAENATGTARHALVPVYDAVVFCDLQCEPIWVYAQVDFIAKACEDAGIPFFVLHSDIYREQARKISHGKSVNMPLWTMLDGKRGKMLRTCTMDYKIYAIQQFVKYNLLGYKKFQRNRDEDLGAHTMHIGFSAEEASRASPNPHPLFENRYPLIELGLERKDNYRYILETWGLETKASACYICPFHKNVFFRHLRDEYPRDYEAVLGFDRILADKPSDSRIKSDLYITYSCKRISDLSDQDCDDAETFVYRGKQIWNGF